MMQYHSPWVYSWIYRSTVKSGDEGAASRPPRPETSVTPCWPFSSRRRKAAMFDDQRKALAAPILALAGAVLASTAGGIVTSLFVNSQIIQEKRIEMAVESFESYITAVATELDKGVPVPGARLSARGHMAIFAEDKVLERLWKFEAELRSPQRQEEQRQEEEVSARQVLERFRELVAEMRAQVGADKVRTDLLDSALFGNQNQ